MNAVWAMDGIRFFGELVSQALDWPLFVDEPVPAGTEIVHIIGMYDPPDYGLTLGATQEARRRVIHWCGSDVPMLRAPEALPPALHCCQSEGLRRELAACGVSAGTVMFPTAVSVAPCALPEQPQVAVYLGSEPEKYGAPMVEACARAMPEVRWRTYGFGELPRDRLAELIRDSSVYLRLTAHDGGATSAREYMAAGRRAVITADLPYAIQVPPDDRDAIVEALERALAATGPDEVAAAYWAKRNSPGRFLHELARLGALGGEAGISRTAEADLAREAGSQVEARTEPLGEAQRIERPLRVLLGANSVRRATGAELGVRDLCLELRRLGHSVDLVASVAEPFLSGLQAAGVGVHDFEHIPDVSDFDLLYVLHPEPAVRIYLSGFLRCKEGGERGPVVVTAVHGVGQPEAPSLLDETTLFIAAWPEVAEWLHDSLGVPKDRIRTVVNGIDLERFAFSPRSRVETESRAGRGEPWTVLWMGTLYQHKTLHLPLVYEAVRAVGDCRLVVLGEGTEADKLRHDMPEAEFLGELFDDDVRDAMLAADVVVGVARCVLEAAAVGRPALILGDPGYDGVFCREHYEGQMHYMASGKAFARAPTSAAIASDIARLRDDPDRREAVVAQARDLIEANHDLRDNVAVKVRVLREALAKGPVTLGSGEMSDRIAGLAARLARGEFPANLSDARVAEALDARDRAQEAQKAQAGTERALRAELAEALGARDRAQEARTDAEHALRAELAEAIGDRAVVAEHAGAMESTVRELMSSTSYRLGRSLVGAIRMMSRLPAAFLVVPASVLVGLSLLLVSLVGRMAVPLRKRVVGVGPRRTVTGVITNHDGRTLLERHLPSVVAEFAAVDGSVVVVDDGSTDDSVDWLAREHPTVRVVALPRNLGLIGACRAGLDAADTDLVFLLNNDVGLEPGCLGPLIELFEDPALFSASPHLAQAPRDGADEAVAEMYLVGGEVDLQFPLLHRPDTEVPEPLPIPFACGGAAMYDRRMLVELGWDSLYEPYYWEDVDVGYRAWKRGASTMHTGRSRAVHAHQQSIGRDVDRSRLGVIIARNKLLFTWKNLTEAGPTMAHAAWLLRRTTTAWLLDRPLDTEFRAVWRGAVRRLHRALAGRLREAVQTVVPDLRVMAASRTGAWTRVLAEAHGAESGEMPSLPSSTSRSEPGTT